jgi:hypothetical protein
MKRFSLFLALLASLLVGDVRLALADNPTTQPYAPVTETLSGKNDVRYYQFKPDTTDPLEIRLSSTDDLTKINLWVHQDSITG